jgi:hypothetical protein
MHWNGVSWEVFAFNPRYLSATSLQGIWGNAANNVFFAGQVIGAANIGELTNVTGFGGSSSAYIYNVAGNSWSAPITMVSTRRDHTQLRLADERVLVVGGRSTVPLATAELFTSATNAFAATAGPMALARYRFAAAQLTEGVNIGKVLICGGFTVAGDTEPTERCELFDPVAQTFAAASSMTYRRGNHSLIDLGGNQFMAAGGMGKVSTRPGADTQLSSAEIYDGNRNRWYAVPHMPTAREEIRLSPLPSAGLVVATGDVAASQYFDVVTRRWSSIRQSLDGPRLGATAATIVPDDLSIGTATDLLLVYGGSNDGGTTMLNTAELLVRDSDTISSGGLNNVFAVVDVPTATTLVINTPEQLSYSLNVGTDMVMMKAEAQAADPAVPGPYLLSPDEGPAITGVSSVLVEAVRRDSQHATLKLTPGDALLFPDETGWLVLSFGEDNQQTPVKYLGWAGPDELTLDYGTQFPADLGVGTTVVLLNSKGPFSPDNAQAQQLGVAYITDSPAGRVEAEKSLDLVVAAGIILNKTVVYPGDRGLGAEEFGADGDKVSDIVDVFGGDN